ncbi:hypothetical protein WA026_011724 [Henosepilachna vigintioctopunctata]|uniref:Peroxisomal leader peptide-processing protease n=1 Tax=Henosepilachna vigintioctopunctata TaxID=420089 RepID=A0AAW1UIH4_9CUCU
MDIRSVLVKFIYHRDSSGSSGIMINNGYVITTFATIAPFLNQSDSQIISLKKSNQPIETYLKEKFGNLPFFIHYKDEEDGPVSAKRAFLDKCFFSEELCQSTKKIFHYWSADSPDKKEIVNLMYLFIILKIELSNTDFQKDVSRWFENLPKAAFRKGQHLRCMSAALGNENFLDHCSVGIVSNIIGKNDSLIFSDMPLTPGSEGSPVHCDSLCSYPVGIVISSTNWWNNECINFSVIADLSQVLQEFLKPGESISIVNKRRVNNENTKLIDAVESSLFQMYNGLVWGTAILIEKEKGILITNAHVVDGIFDNVIHTIEGPIICDVIYSTDSNISLDIAILKTRKPLGPVYKSINFSKNKLGRGDLVYAAGFPIFKRDTNMGPTITEGCISHIHPHVIKTTCSVYPGASGGAILDQTGGLVAIIVSNVGIMKPKTTYFPKFNMNIPISILQPILENYITTEDVEYLKKISQINVSVWNCFSKL